MLPSSSKRCVALCVSLVIAPSTTLSTPAFSQPAPSFSATCADVEDKLADSGLSEDAYFTIEVSGEITVAERDTALSYIGVCSTPDTHVLCITYELDGYRVGDAVILTGAFRRADEKLIVLDPCLHASPGEVFDAVD